MHDGDSSTCAFLAKLDKQIRTEFPKVSRNYIAAIIAAHGKLKLTHEFLLGTFLAMICKRKSGR